MNKIGFERLNCNEKLAYKLFEQAFGNKDCFIDIRLIDRTVDMMKVLQVTLGDNPGVFYFDRTKTEISSSFLGRRRIHLLGSFSQSQLRTMRNDLDAAVNTAVNEIMLSNPVSDYDTLILIYQYLQDHIQYDEKEIKECYSGNSKNPLSHNAYGALVNGLAVCDGVSSAFALLAQEFDYNCTVVSGKASFKTTGFSSHAWNIIQVGDKYYHLDATWDLNHKQHIGEYSYEYFCVDDNAIKTDHEWIQSTTPPCNGQDICYYMHNHCFANNLSQLDDIFTRACKSKMVVVRARVSSKISIPDPEDEYLATRLIDFATSAGRPPQIQYKWNRNTRCFFAKFV